MNPFAVPLLLLLTLLTPCHPMIIDGKPDKVLIVSAIQLQLLVYHYDQVLLLVTETDEGDQSIAEEDRFKDMVVELNATYADDNTVYCITALKYDQFERLTLFGRFPGIKLIKKDLHFNFPRTDYPKNLHKVKDFYAQHVHPQLPFFDKSASSLQFDLRFISVKDYELLGNYTESYNKMYDVLINYKIKAFGIRTEEENPDGLKNGIYLFKNGSLLTKYEGDERDPSQLLNFINVETLPLVSLLDDNNYNRIFGSDLGAQLLLIYRRANTHNPSIHAVRKQFAKAAYHNKHHELYYDRVLFCDASLEFLERYFDQSITTVLGDTPSQESLYRIVLTITNYKRFELLQYPLHAQVISNETIIQFIWDVKSKKIDPEYKSEKIPPESQNQGVLRKIVGHSFIQEIYGDPDQSVLVLFIDSKQITTYQDDLTVLQDFCRKYQQIIRGKLICGYFDFKYNEHKLITINSAPRLVLFEKTNKKMAKLFGREEMTVDSIRSWINFEVTDLTLPGESLVEGNDL